MNAPHTRRSVPEGTRRSAHWWHLRGKNFVPADALSRFPTSGHWFVSPFLRARVIDGVCPLLQTHTHKGNIERIGLSNVCPFRCVRQRVLVSGQHFTLSTPGEDASIPRVRRPRARLLVARRMSCGSWMSPYRSVQFVTLTTSPPCVSCCTFRDGAVS